MTELPFRKNVSIIIFNSEKKLLLGERFNQPGIWQFPQGGVEGEDSLENSVVREIEEELGLISDDIKVVCKLNTTNKYRWEKVPPQFVGKFQGQDQTFWLVELVNKNAKFNLDQDHPEFQNIKWTEIDDVISCVEKVRQDGYSKALVEVRKILFN
jgi:putative (di)nucleoside polyphosphate hydrolase